jgi:hypothetical protein
LNRLPSIDKEKNPDFNRAVKGLDEVNTKDATAQEFVFRVPKA